MLKLMVRSFFSCAITIELCRGSLKIRENQKSKMAPVSLEPALHQIKADTISLWATRTHVGYGKWDCDKPPGPISEFSCFLIRLGCIGPFLELYKRCLVVTPGYFVRSFCWRSRFAHSCSSHGWVAVCSHKIENCGSRGTRIARMT